MNTPLDRERQTRDRALAIAHDAERLRLLIESLPMRTDDMIAWRIQLTQIQSAYIDRARNAERNLRGT